MHREKVKRYVIEHIDLGAYYYRKFFHGKGEDTALGVPGALPGATCDLRLCIRSPPSGGLRPLSTGLDLVLYRGASTVVGLILLSLKKKKLNPFGHTV